MMLDAAVPKGRRRKSADVSFAESCGTLTFTADQPGDDRVLARLVSHLSRGLGVDMDFARDLTAMLDAVGAATKEPA